MSDQKHYVCSPKTEFEENSATQRRQMRTLQITSQKLLSIVEVDTPQPDGSNVIIKVSKVGICGTDLHYWEQESYAGVTMGHEYAGVVVNSGSRTDLKAGDRVTAIPLNPCLACSTCREGNEHLCMQTLIASPGTSIGSPGAFAEYTVSRPDMVRKIPDTISDVEAAMIEPASVALRAVREARVTVGDKVLITGAGIIGLLCAMFARKAGASVVAMTEANSERADGALRYGDAHVVCDAQDPGLIGELMMISDTGFDVCIECAGVGAAIDTGVMALKPGNGVMIPVALNMDPVSILMVWMVVKEIKVRPILGYHISDFDLCLDMIAEKKIDVARFVNHTCGIQDAQDVFVALTSGKCSDVKVLISP